MLGYVRTRMRIVECVCVSCRPCGRKLKNSVTRPDDLLRKLRELTRGVKEIATDKREGKEKGERYRRDTLPLPFASQCRIKQIQFFLFIFFLFIYLFYFIFLFSSFLRVFHDDDDDDRFSQFADTYRYIKSMYTYICVLQWFCGEVVGSPNNLNGKRP